MLQARNSEDVLLVIGVIFVPPRTTCRLSLLGVKSPVAQTDVLVGEEVSLACSLMPLFSCLLLCTGWQYIEVENGWLAISTWGGKLAAYKEGSLQKSFQLQDTMYVLMP